MIKLYIFFSGLSFFYFQSTVYSQELKQIHSWAVRDVVDATSDFMGNLYISDEQGIISKYDKNGLLLLSYSGSNISPIHSVDVSHTSKIFGFYLENQSYLILDRFLNPLNEAVLNNSVIGYASETAYAADNNLWVFDQSDLSIKKINILNQVLVTTISISLIINNEEWDIKQIEEYQNRLYLYDNNKDIYVLDNYGNYIKKLEIKPDCNFWFSGESIIYVQQKKVFKFDLYNSEIVQIGTIGNTNNLLKVISANNLIYLITKSEIIVYG